MDLKLDQGTRRVHLQVLEATAGEYRACVRAGGCPPAELQAGVPFMDDDVPASGLTLEAARAFCAWMGGRLPSEAEWTAAATPSGGGAYPWGDVPPRCPAVQMQNGCGTGGPTRTYDPRSAGPAGHANLAGGVWEWIEASCCTDVGCGFQQRGGGWLSEDLSELEFRHIACVDPAIAAPDAGVRCAIDVLGAFPGPTTVQDR